MNLENSLLGEMIQSQKDKSYLSEVPSAVQSTETGSRVAVQGWGD